MTDEPAGGDCSDVVGAAADERARQAEAERTRVKRIVEALLFASDAPVTASRLAGIAGAADGRLVRSIVRDLQREYESTGRAFCIEEIAGGFQLLTRREFAPWLEKLRHRREQDTLSKAALETLAIVAYRQPITRAEIEDIRGVQCGHILRSLVDRRLAKVAGRSGELGRPLLYGTTRRFLQAFGLRSLTDLPRRAELLRPAAAGEAPDAGPVQPEDDSPAPVSDGPAAETVHDEPPGP